MYFIHRLNLSTSYCIIASQYAIRKYCIILIYCTNILFRIEEMLNLLDEILANTKDSSFLHHRTFPKSSQRRFRSHMFREGLTVGVSQVYVYQFTIFRIPLTMDNKYLNSSFREKAIIKTIFPTIKLTAKCTSSLKTIEFS